MLAAGAPVHVGVAIPSVPAANANLNPYQQHVLALREQQMRQQQMQRQRKQEAPRAGLQGVDEMQEGEQHTDDEEEVSFEMLHSTNSSIVTPFQPPCVLTLLC